MDGSDDSSPTFPSTLVSQLFSYASSNNKELAGTATTTRKLQPEPLIAATEYLRVFTVEAIERAIQAAKQVPSASSSTSATTTAAAATGGGGGGEVVLDAEILERILPQLLLDF